MSRFVLLYHDCSPESDRASHWDLMFESGAVLRTWALITLPQQWLASHRTTQHRSSSCPALAPASSVDAEQLPDHRREYLQYEGPVSAGRGNVYRVAEGTYVIDANSPDLWRVELAGEQIRGPITIYREGASSCWRLTLEPDEAMACHGSA